MTNYENTIMQALAGETPKKKFESLMLLQDENSLLRAKMAAHRQLFETIREMPDDTQLKNLKTFLQ